LKKRNRTVSGIEPLEWNSCKKNFLDGLEPFKKKNFCGIEPQLEKCLVFSGNDPLEYVLLLKLSKMYGYVSSVSGNDPSDDFVIKKVAGPMDMWKKFFE
jgi:hypothetical protein